ncbi:MAG: hypothetical protein ACJAS4_000758 [Bacteriovoracaceae bacterium]|jgi:hypothetical protein
MKKLLITTFIMTMMVPFISFGSTEDTVSTPAGADFCNEGRSEGDTFVEDGVTYEIKGGVKVIKN